MRPHPPPGQRLRPGRPSASPCRSRRARSRPQACSRLHPGPRAFSAAGVLSPHPATRAFSAAGVLARTRATLGVLRRRRALARTRATLGVLRRRRALARTLATLGVLRRRRALARGLLLLRLFLVGAALAVVRGVLRRRRALAGPRSGICRCRAGALRGARRRAPEPRVSPDARRPDQGDDGDQKGHETLDPTPSSTAGRSRSPPRGSFCFLVARAPSVTAPFPQNWPRGDGASPGSTPPGVAISSPVRGTFVSLERGTQQATRSAVAPAVERNLRPDAGSRRSVQRREVDRPQVR